MIEHLEPAAIHPLRGEFGTHPTESEVERSKAISLKRIADALDAQNEMTRTLIGDIA